MAPTGRIIDAEDSHYQQEIDNFLDWCDGNDLVLNDDKTKEMVIDFRRTRSHQLPL